MKQCKNSHKLYAFDTLLEDLRFTNNLLMPKSTSQKELPARTTGAEDGLSTEWDCHNPRKSCCNTTPERLNTGIENSCSQYDQKQALSV